MKRSVFRLALGIAAALATSVGPLATSTQAGLIPWAYESIFGTGGYGGYGYGAGYAPVGYGYTAGYGGGYGGGCCLSNLFRGCGLFGRGCSYNAGYAPSYYAPSYYTPGCGSGCETGCGTCGSSSTYSLGGLCCDNGWNGTCASGNCDSLGCASGNCSSGDCLSDGGSSIGPYSGTPVPDTGRPSSPSNSVLPDSTSQPPNRTYKDQPPGDGFQPPRQEPSSGSGGANPFGGSGSILPSNDESASPSSNPGINIERDGEQGLYKIPAKDHVEPQPTDEKSDESQIVKPLDIQTRVAFRTESGRTRARYRVVFHAPAVTRSDVPAAGGWEPINETKLAASR